MERLGSIWLQLELWAMAVLLTRGEIRCYCDSPHCVATGYMCKSELNACFTRILHPQSSKSLLSHGCSEPGLNGGNGGGGGVCLGEATRHTLRTPVTLECCHEDMCNYRGLQDLTYNQGGSLEHRGRPQADGGRQVIARMQEIPSSKEVWFRAAVIAVPIAGGLVLVLLITMALRMLRSENRRLKQQRREMLSRLHYGFHGQHLTKNRGTKLELEYMMPLGGQESGGLTCDTIRQSDPSSNRLLALVHWGRHGPRGKLELV